MSLICGPQFHLPHPSVFSREGLCDGSHGPIVAGSLTVFEKDNVSYLQVLVRFGPFLATLQGWQVLSTPTTPESVGKSLYLSPLFGEEIFICKVSWWRWDSSFLS